jgi:hypothetical protein
MFVAYRIAMRVLARGERVPFSLDNRGRPLFYPTLFATARLRNTGAPANTTKDKPVHVGVLLWCPSDRRRDLVDDFREGRFLAATDIASLRDFAQRRRRYGMRVIQLKWRQARFGRIRFESRGEMSTSSRFPELYGKYRIQVAPMLDLRVAQHPSFCFDEAHAGRCSQERRCMKAQG